MAGSVKDPLELSEDEWNHVMRTNLTGTWLVSKSVCIRMRDSKRGGSVINIASITGLNRGQLPGGVAYAASKSGVNSMTRVTIYILCLFYGFCYFHLRDLVVKNVELKMMTIKVEHRMKERRNRDRGLGRILQGNY